MNSVKIVRTNSSNSDFRDLVKLLDKDLSDRNYEAQAEYDKHNIIEAIETVVVAYLEAEPAGCGCFKAFDAGVVEIKRMFVKQQYRGRGISRLVLCELETWAIESGNRAAVLETGTRQTAAIGLYERSGYHRIENYGPYRDLPNSLCFQKPLLTLGSHANIIVT